MLKKGYNHPDRALEAINLILEINTCVLLLSSALSSGVFPARNYGLCQLTNSRKIPPLARFNLPRPVFHRKGQSGVAVARVTRVPGIKFRSTRDTRAPGELEMKGYRRNPMNSYHFSCPRMGQMFIK